MLGNAHPCARGGMERFQCSQSMFVAVERRNRVIDSTVLRDVDTAEFPNETNDTLRLGAGGGTMG